jgi:hypothetical protein
MHQTHEPAAGAWQAMPQKPGAHGAYARADGSLVVEWYDFGDHAPYESANLLIFDAAAQGAFAGALGLPAGMPPQDLAAAVAKRFDSWFDVKQFARERGLPFAEDVDFEP